MSEQKTLKNDYFVLRGDLLQERQKNKTPLSLRSLGIISTEEPPKYGKHILKNVVITGKTRDAKILFKRSPFKIKDYDSIPEQVEPERFIVAIPYFPHLDNIEVTMDGRVVASMDRSRKAHVDLDYARTKKGLRLKMQGVYDHLEVKAFDTESSAWSHFYLDDQPTTDKSEEALMVPWERFPIARKVVVEAIATRGLDVDKAQTTELDVDVPPARINIYCAGIRKREITEIAEEKKEKDIKLPLFEIMFLAKGYLHGVSLPESAFVWEIKGKKHRGRYALIQHKSFEKFEVKVKALDQLKRTATAELKDFDPRKYLKKAQSEKKTTHASRNLERFKR